jgi:hypothetical protein
MLDRYCSERVLLRIIINDDLKFSYKFGASVIYTVDFEICVFRSNLNACFA